jgi:hypothetical protein
VLDAHPEWIRPEDAEVEDDRYVYGTEYGDIIADHDAEESGMFRVHGCTRYNSFTGFWDLNDGAATILVVTDRANEKPFREGDDPTIQRIDGEFYTFRELYTAVMRLTGDIE